MELEKLKPAPVVLVAYNRFEHFKQTLKSLKMNSEAQETEVYLFIDGPKNEDDSKVQELIVNHA